MIFALDMRRPDQLRADIGMSFNRRGTLALFGKIPVAGWLWLWVVLAANARVDAAERPNILIAIADDQSWVHTSAAGYRAVATPAFDRVCRQGVRLTQCIAGSPGCSPSRAALLTGYHHWQLEEAGTHDSSFPKRFITFPDRLEQAGFFVGCTGKGWGPGNWKVSGRTRNPAGTAFDRKRTTPPYKGISKSDYAANFAEYLHNRPQGRPFCFWFGAAEPHREYEPGSGLRAGKRLDDAAVPPFLPDVPAVRSDLLDYCVEIEWFDRHLGRMLDMLEKSGELHNTLVIVTADNGMSFPRAKANLYEFGIHVPLTISWPDRVPGGRVIDDLVGFVDLTATILEAARVDRAAIDSGRGALVGKSLLNVLTTDKQGLVDRSRTMVFTGRERHASARHGEVGYPGRAIRTQDYLYIRNFHAERWPAGDPREYTDDGRIGPVHGAYRDIDSAPSLQVLVQSASREPLARFLQLAVAKRSADELYDIRRDPGCLTNLAADRSHESTLQRLRQTLFDYLKKTGDPRMGSDPDIFDSYPRFGAKRQFPEKP
jgi:N-sulfoglucosamine sulfohydrolase